MVSISLHQSLSTHALEKLSANTDASARSISRLSSGNRITRAADDVAALATATKLDTRVVTLRRAQLNVEQANSLLQVMDGALGEIETILLRMNALAVQSSSGALTTNERSFLNQEFQQLSNEIDRLAQQTNFNGVKMLNLDGARESLHGCARVRYGTRGRIRPRHAL